MKQNDNRIFRKEDLDWKTLETIGIHKEELEKSGDMELLLQGEETETVPLKIRTPIRQIGIGMKHHFFITRKITSFIYFLYKKS